MRIRFISPEETQAALTRLQEHGATGYGGYGPPTATEVGFHDQDFVTLPEDLLELLLFLPDLQKICQLKLIFGVAVTWCHSLKVCPHTQWPGYLRRHRTYIGPA